MAWTVSWRVLINGRDLTSAWRPVLIDIEIEDRDGTSSDTCSLTIDDTDGQVRLPNKGDRLMVFLEGGKVFEGFIEQPQSSGSRSAGRVLKIRAKGFDSTGKVKEPQGFHMDDASLEAFLSRAAGHAGMTINIDPDFAGIVRDYWSAEGESFLALGNRMAKKLGGTFKIRGDRAVLAKRGAESVGAVLGIVGQNVISWDITPRAPRRAFKSGSAKWFDRKSAQFVTETLKFGAEGVEADNLARDVMADADEAREANDTCKREGERDMDQRFPMATPRNRAPSLAAPSQKPALVPP
ncbi:hypothetical protein GCM10007989_04760 [Devosia pacifica]|uniref:Late control D family protein n=1 Tax=Devosia pacifica TaxID=1335967 RepID=A0A918RUH7_9HYPH|nr:late control D family protein [Devosia pacifica]GHA13225.1 hypothetical protein GCM10007989_04760 [Devosia pacifica]